MNSRLKIILTVICLSFAGLVYATTDGHRLIAEAAYGAISAAVPEPSAYAAVFGIAALLSAALRRKNSWSRCSGKMAARHCMRNLYRIVAFRGWLVRISAFRTRGELYAPVEAIAGNTASVFHLKSPRVLRNGQKEAASGFARRPPKRKCRLHKSLLRTTIYPVPRFCVFLRPVVDLP